MMSGFFSQMVRDISDLYDGPALSYDDVRRLVAPGIPPRRWYHWTSGYANPPPSVWEAVARVSTQAVRIELTGSYVPDDAVQARRTFRVVF